MSDEDSFDEFFVKFISGAGLILFAAGFVFLVIVVASCIFYAFETYCQ